MMQAWFIGAPERGPRAEGDTMAEKKITPKDAGTEKAASKTKAAGVTKKTLRQHKKVTARTTHRQHI